MFNYLPFLLSILLTKQIMEVADLTPQCILVPLLLNSVLAAWVKASNIADTSYVEELLMEHLNIASPRGSLS